MAAGTRDASGRPGRRYWQLWTEYTIGAKLDPETATVTGRETIVVRNPGPTPIASIMLRLEQNRFRSDSPSAQHIADSNRTGGMIITRITVGGQVVPLEKVVGLTSTVAQIPGTIPARGATTLEIEWHFQVPYDGGRVGRIGNSLFQVTMWYPRVMVYDDVEGWDTEPYRGISEFYNNYGRFDVSLDVPAGWVVGATGVLQNPKAVLTPVAQARLASVTRSDSVRQIVTQSERGPGRATAGRAGERLIWHFVADTVSDFAWATSDRYAWDAFRANTVGTHTVPVHVLYLPEDSARAVTIVAEARHALAFYSTRMIPYAFPQLTLVRTVGCCMEYPMFVAGLSSTDHEIGHQWWPMMVGSNETRYGWMDEEFSQYTGSEVIFRGEKVDHDGMAQRYGKQSGQERTRLPSPVGSQARPPAAFHFPEMLAMLGGVVGDSAVMQSVAAYSRAWRFKHPTPWDYMLATGAALRQDLGWFWYAWLFPPTHVSVDGSIDTVISAGARTTVRVRQAGKMPSPIVLEVTLAPRGPALSLPPNARLADSTTAIVTFPVDVWFDGRWTFDVVLDFGGRPIERIRLDPQGRFPDQNVTDNVWPRTTSRP